MQRELECNRLNRNSKGTQKEQDKHTTRTQTEHSKNNKERKRNIEETRIEKKGKRKATEQKVRNRTANETEK